MKERIYLDYAAATPVDAGVSKAMTLAACNFANPSAQYASARQSKLVLEKARKEVAMLLGANTEEIVFTSGATESNNLAILGAARAHKKGQIITIGTEHASVREPIKQLKQEGYDVVWCKVGSDGILSKKDFEKALSKDTILVSIAYANGETGTVQPIVKIAKIIREFEKANKTKIIFHTDASAASPFLNCEVSRLGVDLLTLSANKIYGPAGVGAIYIRRKLKIKPIFFGGSQEFGLRAGTQPVELAAGMAAAIKKVKKQSKRDQEAIGSVAATFDCVLMDQGAIFLAGPLLGRNRLPNVRCLYFDGVNGEDIVAQMDAKGFEIATGAACEAANEDPSPALLAHGLTKSQAQGSVRISFGRSTTWQQAQAAAEAMVVALETLGYKWDNN